MKVGKMLNHQGYTDIVNTLPLINYYLKTYDRVDMLVREEVTGMINYYLQQFDGAATVTYGPIHIVDGGPSKWSDIFSINPTDDILFTGCYDQHRTDKYKNNFEIREREKNNHGLGMDNPDSWWHRGGFLEAFYTTYDVDYIERIDSFNLRRDHDLESKLYKKFKANHCTGDYVLVHEDVARDVRVVTKPPSPNIKSFNLNQSSCTFFDFIQILINAKEMHMIDSSWAAVCYLLDCKFGLFKNIPITITCLPPRDYHNMFTSPKELDNWFIRP